MNVVRDAETERVLAESKRLRDRLGSAVTELSDYVEQLQAYVDKLHEVPPVPHQPEEER